MLSVGGNGLRVRSQPSLAGSLVTTVKAGRQLTVLDPAANARDKVGKQNQWLKVRTPDGKEGYVAAWYVTLDDAAPGTPAAGPAPAASALTVAVSGLVGSGGIRLRAAPTTASTPIKIEPAGTHLTVLEPAATATGKVGVYGQWLKVRDPQGAEGYVAAWYVQK